MTHTQLIIDLLDQLVVVSDHAFIGFFPWKADREKRGKSLAYEQVSVETETKFMLVLKIKLLSVGLQAFWTTDLIFEVVETDG